MQIQYLIVRHDDMIVGSTWRPDPDAGPTIPQGGSPIDGTILVRYDEEFTRAGRADTEAAHLVDDAVVWVETVPPADVIKEVLDRIDADADAARVSVLVKTTKAEEYMQAEAQARAWQAAGYLGAAPPDVASWAAAKYRDGMTEQQAAENILAQADQYRSLLSGIRALRLKHMEDARHAIDAAGARAALAAFTVAQSNLMKGLA